MAKFALNQPTTLDIKKNEKKSSMNQFTSIPNINCYESRFILKALQKYKDFRKVPNNYVIFNIVFGKRLLYL